MLAPCWCNAHFPGERRGAVDNGDYRSRFVLGHRSGELHDEVFELAQLIGDGIAHAQSKAVRELGVLLSRWASSAVTAVP